MHNKDKRPAQPSPSTPDISPRSNDNNYCSGGEQEQLTAVRGYAVQEAEDVESSALEKLEGLKQDYEVEVEQLGSDLAVRRLMFSDYGMCRITGSVDGVLRKEVYRASRQNVLLGYSALLALIRSICYYVLPCSVVFATLGSL